MEKIIQPGLGESSKAPILDQRKPLIVFYKLSEQLASSDTYSTLGYLRSSFELAIIQHFHDSSPTCHQNTSEEGFLRLSMEEALLCIQDSWLITPSTFDPQNDPYLETLKEKTAVLVAAGPNRPEIKRHLFYGPVVKTDGGFKTDHITHWGQLFPRIMVLSAVEKSPSIWHKSLAFLTYWSDRVEHGGILQDAYPLYFVPAASADCYFKIATKDEIPLLLEKTAHFALSSLSFEQDAAKTESITTAAALLSPEVNPDPCEGSQSVHLVLSAERPPSIVLLDKTGGKSGPKSPHSPESLALDGSGTQQGYLHLHKPVGALFDSFVLGERVITNIRDIGWGRSTQSGPEETTATAASNPTHEADTGPGDSADAQRAASAERTLLQLRPAKAAGLSSLHLTSLGNLAKKRILAGVRLLPGERDKHILQLAQKLRKDHSLESSHGLRFLYMLDEVKNMSETVSPRITIIGVAGLFSSTWGGLSPSDLASLHGPLVDYLNDRLARARKGAGPQEV